MRGWLRVLLAVGLVAVSIPSHAHTQAVGTTITAVLPSPSGGGQSLGYTLRPAGIFDATLSGVHLGAWEGDRWGVAVDFSMWRQAGARVYPTGGFGAGWGAGTAADTWSAWSAGLGYRLIRSGAFDFALEGRYLHVSIPDDAFTLGVRMALRVGRSRSGPKPAPAAVPTAPPLAIAAPTARSALAQGIIQSALDAMGTPYAWGGSDANGFDCSGLIRYAYGEHGIDLPRRSADQAREGVAVEREVGALLPGDIVAFGSSPDQVTHVGLYLGQGRFIHSAATGVRISLLSQEDPDGRYWWQRWITARRILQP
jgi:cell wall-associated NlpC family hydrolase